MMQRCAARVVADHHDAGDAFEDFTPGALGLFGQEQRFALGGGDGGGNAGRPQAAAMLLPGADVGAVNANAECRSGGHGGFLSSLQDERSGQAVPRAHLLRSLVMQRRL